MKVPSLIVCMKLWNKHTMGKKGAFRLLRHVKNNKDDATHKELKDDATSNNRSKSSKSSKTKKDVQINNNDEKENIAPTKTLPTKATTAMNVTENASQSHLVGIESELSCLREQM